MFTAAHAFRAYSDLSAYYERDKLSGGQRYGRDSSPEVWEAERALEAFCGKKALLFGSGMSACTAALDVFMDRDRVLYVPHEHYRKLKDLAGCRWAGYREYGDVSALRPDGPSLIWVESPSNPHLRLTDYMQLAALKDVGPDIRVIADFTLAGLNNYIGPGIFDAEIHSCAKYAGGHNDLMAGVILTGEEWYPRLWEHRSFAGGILDPFSAWLLSRSLKTYRLRIERQVETAGNIVRWLSGRLPKDRIFYPGYGANEDQRAISLFHGHRGSVVSFLLDGDPRTLTDRVGGLATIRMAPNFGAVDSLIEVCATMSHYGKSAAELGAAGIEPNLIRLSVGVEPIADLLADLETLFGGCE